MCWGRRNDRYSKIDPESIGQSKNSAGPSSASCRLSFCRHSLYRCQTFVTHCRVLINSLSTERFSRIFLHDIRSIHTWTTSRWLTCRSFVSTSVVWVDHSTARYRSWMESIWISCRYHFPWTTCVYSSSRRCGRPKEKNKSLLILAKNTRRRSHDD